MTRLVSVMEWNGFGIATPWGYAEMGRRGVYLWLFGEEINGAFFVFIM